MSDTESLKDFEGLCSLQGAEDETWEDFLTLPAHLVPIIIRRGEERRGLLGTANLMKGNSARTSTRHPGDPV